MKHHPLSSRKLFIRSLWVLAAVAMTSPLLMAQAGKTPAIDSNLPVGRVWIRPSIVHVEPGQQQQFRILKPNWLLSATVMEGVKWSVNDIPGGNAQIGTIDANGLYTAPAKAPTPHEIHICADAEGAPNRYLWATLIIGKEQPTYEMVTNWPVNRGKVNRHQGGDNDVHSITVDPNGNLIITDEGTSHVWRYTPDGKLLGQIGLGPGASQKPLPVDGHLNAPRAATVDKQGDIFIADQSTEGMIHVFSPDGKFLYRFGPKGTGPGMMLRPHGVQFGPKGHLFVDDVDNFRISVFDKSGKFLHSWGHGGLKLGGFNPPHGIVLDKNGDVFVDSYYGPAQKFTADGEFLKAFAYPEPPDGPVYFHSIGGDRWGDVYLTTRSWHLNPKSDFSVVKYNDNGDFVTTLKLHPASQQHVKWVAVANDGTVYALYTSPTAGVQVLKEQ